MAAVVQLPEPPPCYGVFSTQAEGQHYFWKGWGPGRRENIVSIFNVYNEHWTGRHTFGNPPPGLVDGQCTFLSNKLFVFGGSDGNSLTNGIYKLDMIDFQWSQLASGANPSKVPIPKKGCGLVPVNERTLACFGGHGLCPSEASPLFIKDKNHTNSSGWTNELHFFDIVENAWSSPEVRGDRPPPCAAFSFTKVDQHRAVLFGGKMPGKGRVNNLYLFDFSRKEVMVRRLEQGGVSPVARSGQAACCLNYGEDRPVLLVSGGVDKDNHVLNDLWMLDVNTGRWTEVTLPPGRRVEGRYWHSATATCLVPGLSEVLMFGGCREWQNYVKSFNDLRAITDTIILQFELATDSPPTGPPTEKWTLVDVVHNNSRALSQRLKDKMLKLVRNELRGLEQQLRAAERRAEDAEQRERDASFHHEDIVQSSQESEQRMVLANKQLTADNKRLENDLNIARTVHQLFHDKEKELEERLLKAEERASDAEQRAAAAVLQNKDMNSKVEETVQSVGEVERRNRELSADIEQLREELQLAQEENQRLLESQELAHKENQHLLESQELAVRELRDELHLAQEESQHLQEAQELALVENRRLLETQETLQAENRRLHEAQEEYGAHDIEPWKVSRDKVEVIKEIAAGGWGVVSEGKVRVAIKQLHTQILLPRNVERLRREMKILAKIRHPHLVQFIGAVFDEQVQQLRAPPLIVTELMDTNLRKAYEEDQLPERNKLPIFIQVAEALLYLHHRHEPIIHRDVSAPNVLLQRTHTGEWRGKLSDLGSANLARAALTLGEGAILYSAPETIPSASNPDAPVARQTVKLDVYSYGVLLCEVIVARLPEANHYGNMCRQIQREWPVMHELIVWCTRHSPDQRPDMKDVLIRLQGMANSP